MLDKYLQQTVGLWASYSELVNALHKPPLDQPHHITFTGWWNVLEFMEHHCACKGSTIKTRFDIQFFMNYTIYADYLSSQLLYYFKIVDISASKLQSWLYLFLDSKWPRLNTRTLMTNVCITNCLYVVYLQLYVPPPQCSHISNIHMPNNCLQQTIHQCRILERNRCSQVHCRWIQNRLCSAITIYSLCIKVWHPIPCELDHTCWPFPAALFFLDRTCLLLSMPLITSSIICNMYHQGPIYSQLARIGSLILEI